MINSKVKIILLIVMMGLPIPVLSETVFEEVRVVYDGGGQDNLSSAAVDIDGNMYITGVGINGTRGGFIAKYDSYGSEEWVRYPSGSISNGNKMIVDRDGNAYVVLSGELGKTLKYDSEGNESVLADPQIVPYGCCGRAVGLVFDNDENNLYSWASHTIQKISLDGGAGWAQRLHTASYMVVDVAVDVSGNIYAVGYSLSVVSGVVVKKLDSSGNVIWSRLLQDEGVSGEVAYGLELDANNNVYVLLQAGSYEDAGSYTTTSLVASISSDGSVVNSVVLHGTYGYMAGGIKVVDDKVYALTRKRAQPTAMIVQKLNVDLSLVWSSAEYLIGYRTPQHLDVDGLGNVVVGVNEMDNKTAIVKFDANGSDLWTIKGEGRNPVLVEFGRGGDVYAADAFLDGFMYRYDVTQLTCQ